MLAEIQEQPAVLRRLVAEGWGPASAVARALRERGFRAVMLAARGTSDNAAYYARYLFEVFLGVPAALASASTFTLYKSEMDLAGVLVIGISQSGESKEVLETIHGRGTRTGCRPPFVEAPAGRRGGKTARWAIIIRWDLRVLVGDVSAGGEGRTR